MVDLQFSDVHLARLYDVLYAAGSGRRDFDVYLPLVMAAESVLDVGCGTGALLQQARRLGHRGYLCGLDPAAAMIEVARRRPDIEWLLGDLASTHFARRFDLIVMTGHTFQVFLGDDEIRRALTAVHELLALHGYFAFETRNPAARSWQSWPQKYAADVVDPLGRRVSVSCRIDTPFDGRVVSFSQTYTSPAWDKPRVSSSTLRFVDSTALAAFLAEAGFDVESQFGDWDRTALTDTSPEMITIARRR